MDKSEHISDQVAFISGLKRSASGQGSSQQSIEGQQIGKRPVLPNSRSVSQINTEISKTTNMKVTSSLR